MLKIVGLSHGKVADEKILLDEDGKLTKYGIAALIIVGLAVISVLIFIHEVKKLGRWTG